MSTLARVWIGASIVGLLACGTPGSAGPTAESSPPSESTPGESTPTESSAGDSPGAGPSPFLDDEELASLGFRVEPLDGDQARLCQGDGCLCREPLDTDMTFEENLRVFREALAGGQGAGAERRSVMCQTGEVGRCGEFRYFLFVGDTYRHEIRWFDADGAMVAWRNVTDYDAFCGGSLARWKGRVPRCEHVEPGELICGERQPVRTPVEDLRSLAAGHGPPGAGP